MRLLPRLRGIRSRRAPTPPSADFDPAFYRTRYPDLAGLPPAALAEHYARSGRAEGRSGNPRALVAALEAWHGALPFDFDPDAYRGLNDDLATVLGQAWAFTAHFLEHGRAEGRRYSAIERPLAEEFRRLLVADARAGRPGGDPAAGEDALARYLIAHRLTAGPWLERFKLADFSLANAAWLPPPTSRSAALQAFVERGIDRLAPVAMDLPFDAAFYRAAYAAGETEAQVSDAYLYRRWLGGGSGRGEAPSEAAGLERLTESTRFPDAFDEAAYRVRRPDAPPTRFRALEHFILEGFPSGVGDVVAGPDAPTLFEAIGRWHGEHWRPEPAARAYAYALAGADSSTLWYGRGEALSELGLKREAAEAHERATGLGGAVTRSAVRAAVLRSELGEHARALDALSNHPAPEQPKWRDAAAVAIRGRFGDRSEAARMVYAGGERAEADALMEAALAEVAGNWERFGFLPGRLPPAEAGPILILANLDLPQCVHYRVEQKRRQLERGGWTVAIHDQHEPLPFIEALTGARAAIFYRTAAFPDVVRAILHARALGVPTYYEVDDLIFDAALYPDPIERFEGQVSPEEYAVLLYGVPLFRGAMALCEAGIASTPALAEAMRCVVRSGVCHVLRNGLDERNDAGLARPRPARDPEAGWITLFYGSGTRAHNADFTQLAAPGLLALLARHSRVRLVIAGYLALDARFDPYRDRVLELGFTRDVDAYWEALGTADVNLAVLAPGAAADAKSEIKWLEAACLGIPSIVSATRTYREVLTDGEDALLVDSAEAWGEALERLVGDATLRRRIGAAARAKALSTYSLDRGTEVLASFLPPPGAEDGAWGRALTGAAAASEAALARGRARSAHWAPQPLGPAPAPPAKGATRTSAPRKPRLLIVNVFLPPQTIGGATRVVRDNVDYLLDHAPDHFDIVLAAADEGVKTPYRTRVDAYRGRPVLRVATPREERMDWRPTDPAVGELFEAFLSRLAPDLIHFHCVQRLTVSVVEAAQRRGIPYFVTVHDGWWISDHQFLIDEDGKPRPPTHDPLSAAPGATVEPLGSVARRRRLGRALSGARRVLAVSDTFAALYRGAGVANIAALPNGLPSLPPALPRMRSTDGRVRLGHLGGRAAHKGAMLLEATLRGTPFRHLSLMIVDLSKDHGHASAETWGTTPVTVIGRAPQDAMAELYAALDVLVAPSLWPESFGLVTREAQAYGLWVIASDRGAMSEGIELGTNGFVADVSGIEGLRGALGAIDADPERFRVSPPVPSVPLRRSADQGAELLDLYGRVLMLRPCVPQPGEQMTMVSAFDEASRYVNVALNRPTSQSSRPEKSALSGIVNGDHDQAFGLQTLADEKPWWQVDLQMRLPLEGVVVYNRQDGDQEGARRLRIEISDDGESWTTIHAGYCQFGSRRAGSPLVVPLGGVIWGRHVRLSLDDKRELILSQVEVYVSRSNLDMLRVREELELDVALDGEREGVTFYNSYRLVAAPGTPTSTPLMGLALEENGAFGNCLLQYGTAILVARKMGLSLIKVAQKDRSEMIRLTEPMTLEGITFVPAGHPLPEGGPFLSGYFFGINEFRRRVPIDYVYEQAHRVIRHMVRPIFNRLPAAIPPKPEDELHIHIRSGDIFANWVNAIYTQPPLAFYKLVVDRLVAAGTVSRVKLVYENKLNPVIEPLEAWLEEKDLPFTVSSGSVVDDVVALVNAKYLVFGFGSFGPGVCHLCDAVETVFYFAPGHEQGFRGIPTVKNTIEVIDKGGGYIKIGEFDNSPEQRARMVEYPIEKLGVFGEI